jgi:ribonuclease P protein component
LGPAPANSFPKSLRLLSRGQFLAMNGRDQARLRLEGYLVVARQNRLGHNRLGVTTTRKVGKAVARNRFKRLAREFFRRNQASWPQGFDLLFIALQGLDPFKKGLDADARPRFRAFLENVARKSQKA